MLPPQVQELAVSDWFDVKIFVSRADTRIARIGPLNRLRHHQARYMASLALGLLGMTACGVSRNAAYFELLGQFGKAQSRCASQPEMSWSFEVPLARPGVVARVFGRKGMDVIRVHYSDEPAPRALYGYVDYSNPIDVRVDRSLLYVYWAEILFSSKAYVIAYDLEDRRVLAKRRVDPKDIPGAVNCP